MEAHTNQAVALDEQRNLFYPVECPMPVPAADEVLVEVHFSPLNEMDLEIRSGHMPEWLRQAVSNYRKLGSAVTGFEFAGKRVDSSESVYGMVPVVGGPRCHARYISVPENTLTRLPEGIAMDAAAATICMGLTAITVVEDMMPVAANAQVLVIGAAGGLGAM